MEVYLVRATIDEDYSKTIGIYSSLEKAKEAIERFEDYRDHMIISTIETYKTDENGSFKEIFYADKFYELGCTVFELDTDDDYNMKYL